MARKTAAAQTEQRETTWGDATTEASQIDPPPKRFRARLSCTLTDRELAEHGRRYADADAELESFDADTKQILATRKAERAELDGKKKRHRQILSTGREDRDIECVEHVSIRQGRKWRVRLDTGETYEEAPLTDGERQSSLPNVFGEASGRPYPRPSTDDGPEVDEPAVGDGEIDVTDPGALLRIAESADDEE